MKFAPMAIPAMALLQHHDARRDILTELAVRRHAAIEAQGHSELGAQSGRKNQPACVYFLLQCPSFHWCTSAFVVLGSSS